MSDLHLTASIIAFDILSAAIRKGLLAGEAYAVNDIPGTGPLDDGIKRKAFLRSLNFRKEGVNWSDAEPNAFAPWLRLQQRLWHLPPTQLIIWAAGDGDDYVFLRMACRWLENIPVNVMVVKVPPKQNHYSLYVYSDEELAPMAHQAVPLDDMKRHALAREYDTIVSRPELLRECDKNGMLQFLKLSAYDDRLLAECNQRWKSAIRVIGQVLGLSNTRNNVNDAFLCSRLEHLIITGRIIADAPRTELRAFRVRLPYKRKPARSI